MRELLNDYIPLTEAAVDQGEVTLTVIQPGFNASKQRYYPPEMLKRDFGIFEGVKMYADHPTANDEKQRPERSIREWAATLISVYAEEDGTVKGKAKIVEPWLHEKLNLLRDQGMLGEMGVSINAIGSASKAEIQGQKTNMVERLIRARSVDFVTEPGAGGKVNLYESDTHDVDLIEIDTLRELRPDLVETIEADIKASHLTEVKRMSEQEKAQAELQESLDTVTKERDWFKLVSEEADKAKAKAEAQATIKEAVDKAELPDAAKTRLMEQFSEAVSAEGVEEAVKKEIDYIATLTEAGKVKGLGAAPSDPKPEALKEAIKKLNPEYTDEQVEAATKGR